MSSTGSNRHTRSQSRRRPSTSPRSSEVGSGDLRPSCGCRWSTGNQSSVTSILERSHRLHRSRNWARKKRGAQTKGCVKPGTRGGAHNQKRAHDRGARPRRALHPAPRHAAQEKVGTKEKGAQNPTGASNPEHGAARTIEGVRPIGEHDR